MDWSKSSIHNSERLIADLTFLSAIDMESYDNNKYIKAHLTIKKDPKYEVIKLLNHGIY